MNDMGRFVGAYRLIREASTYNGKVYLRTSKKMGLAEMQMLGSARPTRALSAEDGWAVLIPKEIFE